MLTPGVMVSGGGTFGSCLGPKGGALANGISGALITPLLPCAVSPRKRPAVNQERGSH